MPHRKHPAHGVLDADGQATIVFGTVCKRHRQPWLANDEVHNLLRTVWRSADAWRLGRYVIMPDHIHFFAGWSGAAITFDAWASYWKSQFTMAFTHPDCRWQTDHWDARMRNVTDYQEKWIYVPDNPRRQGLVSQPEDWPYQGEIHPLRWE